MKRMYIVALLFLGSISVTILYSCVKETLAGNEPAPQAKNYQGAAAFVDSSCKICSETKTITLIPNNFFGPLTCPGIELASPRGRATISDIEVQSYIKLNVTAVTSNGLEAALPLFYMGADGSYESLNYNTSSSVLMLYYVRFNKSTNTFTYKPVNNLVVKYSITRLS